MAETQYKKGNLPHNTKPIGWERKNKDGYIEVKVAMRPSAPNRSDNFELKHRIIWEEHFGEVPEGHVVTFLDGDKSNFELSNLALLTRGEHAIMTSGGLRSEDKELTKVGIGLARLIQAKTRTKKRVKRNA